MQEIMEMEIDGEEEEKIPEEVRIKAQEMDIFTSGVSKHHSLIRLQDKLKKAKDKVAATAKDVSLSIPNSFIHWSFIFTEQQQATPHLEITESWGEIATHSLN